MTRVQAAHQ